MKTLAKKLKEKNLKVTPQRLAIYNMLSNTTKHPTAETIYDTLRRQVEDAFDYYRVIVWAHPSIIIDRLSKRGIDKKDKYDSLSEAQFTEMVDTYIRLAKDEVHFNEEKTFLLNTDKLTIEEEVKSFEDIFNHIKGMHEQNL